MVIKINYTSSDVYVSTSVSPVYVVVNYSGTSGGGGNFVPYTGATGDVDLGEFALSAGQVTLDTTPTGTASVATTRWNDTIGSSETTLKGGNVILKNGVDLVARVVNKVTPNTTLTKAAYQAVKISGAQGQRLAVALAQANNDTNSADTIGLVTETIATNQEGFIMTMGNIEGINTTGSLQGETWADGDVLYLSPTTAGRLTNIKPTGATGHIVVIGYVEYSHINNGKIYVKIMNGWELDELHNVYITSPANNDALIYESATSLWKNKTIATALGYTPVPNTRTLTINGTAYDLSADRSWTVSSANIYTADGTLSGNRSLTHGGFNLSFIGATYTNRFTAAGRLLLGTTTESTYLLDVNGTARVSGDMAISNGTFNFNSNGGVSKIRSYGNDILSVTTNANGLFAFGYSTTSNLNLAKISINNANNTYYAINIITPTSQIGAGAKIVWNDGTAGAGSIYHSDIALYDMGMANLGAHYIHMFASGNVILTSGTRTDAGYKLDVNGTARVSGNIVSSGGNIYIPSNASYYWGNVGGSNAYMFSNTATTISAVTTTGSVSFGKGLNVGSQLQSNTTGIEVPSVVIKSGSVGSYSSFNLYYDAGYKYYANGFGNIIESDNNGNLIFSQANSGTTGSSATINEIFRIPAQSGNVLIGGTTNNTSAILNVTSTTKGFLPPRGTNAQMLAIASPATGLMFYDTTNNKLNCYDGTTWQACW